MKHGSKPTGSGESSQEGRPGIAESFELPMHLPKQSRAADSGVRCQALISSQPGDEEGTIKALTSLKVDMHIISLYMPSQGSFPKSRSAEQFLKWK